MKLEQQIARASHGFHKDLKFRSFPHNIYLVENKLSLKDAKKGWESTVPKWKIDALEAESKRLQAGLNIPFRIYFF